MFEAMVTDCMERDLPERRILAVAIAAAIRDPALRERILSTLFRFYLKQGAFDPAEEALSKIESHQEWLNRLLKLIQTYLGLGEFQSVDRMIRKVPHRERDLVYLWIAIYHLNRREFERAIVAGSKIIGDAAHVSLFRDLFQNLEANRIPVRATLGRTLETIDPQNRERCLRTWFDLLLERREKGDRNAEARATWIYEQMEEGLLRNAAQRRLVCSL